ncbi:MAG: hypothetical protein J6I73_05315 [Treponema sp.]|nr:hypothetical protein [Treponema sp.]
MLQVSALFAFAALAVSCNKSNVIESVEETELFSLSYGYFDDELNMFSISDVGNIHTNMTMRDGFFYIANGEAGKIMELNSYGDLLTLYYNEDDSESVNSIFQSASFPAAVEQSSGSSVRKAISYPFNKPGAIAVDSRKYMYIASEMPKERQEKDESGMLLYSQIVLRFSRNGNAEDFIGQQGVGGTPFSFIKNIYTTNDDELVVVCATNNGLTAYWFSENGVLLYEIPLLEKDVPLMPDASANAEIIAMMQEAIPDYSSRTLFIKVDYYTPRIDEDAKIESGIDYVQTIIFPLSIETGQYGTPITIPPYEETISADYSKLVFRLPYDFLGVSSSGWLFFIISTSNGFNVEMVQPSSQKILQRQFNINHDNMLYYSLSLSDAGIISALFIEKEKARVVWWRTDSLTAAIVKS